MSGQMACVSGGTEVYLGWLQGHVLQGGDWQDEEGGLSD